MVEWVEVRGKSIEVAVTAAMSELGIADKDRVQVDVIQEPEKGFLGLGGRDAIVRVKPKPAGGRRRKRGGRASGDDSGGRRRSPDGPSRDNERSGGRSGGSSSGSRSATRQGGQRSAGQKSGGSGRGTGGRQQSSERPRQAASERPRREQRMSTADPHAQAPMVASFLEGLVESFGLEGEVVVTVQEDVVIVNVSGDQTEALVGTRGSVMEAIHEITKTVLHRQADDTARVRIDIAGYAERRRQALSIYAGQLIEQVIGEGGEIMLEPMSAADRKVIHDAVAAREGVSSYSEGEAPRRYVVIAVTDVDESDDDSPVHARLPGDGSAAEVDSASISSEEAFTAASRDEFDEESPQGAENDEDSADEDEHEEKAIEPEDD